MHIQIGNGKYIYTYFDDNNLNDSVQSPLLTKEIPTEGKMESK